MNSQTDAAELYSRSVPNVRPRLGLIAQTRRLH